MKKRGYRPVREECQEFLGELKALTDLESQLLGQIDALPTRRITEVELARDLGYTPTGLRMLKKAKYLVSQTANGNRRPTYDLREALRLRVQLPGLATAPTTRTRGRHTNITGVLRYAVGKVAKS